MVEQNIVSKLIIMSINTAPIRIDIMFSSFYNKESGFSVGSVGGGWRWCLDRRRPVCCNKDLQPSAFYTNQQTSVRHNLSYFLKNNRKDNLLWLG